MTRYPYYGEQLIPFWCVISQFGVDAVGYRGQVLHEIANKFPHPINVIDK